MNNPSFDPSTTTGDRRMKIAKPQTEEAAEASRRAANQAKAATPPAWARLDHQRGEDR